MKNIIDKIITAESQLVSSVIVIESQLSNDITQSEYNELSSALNDFYNTHFSTTRKIYYSDQHGWMYKTLQFIINDTNYALARIFEYYNQSQYYRYPGFALDFIYPPDQWQQPQPCWEYLQIENGATITYLAPKRNGDLEFEQQYIIWYNIFIYKVKKDNLHVQKENECITLSNKQLIVDNTYYVSHLTTNLSKPIQLPKIQADQCYAINFNRGVCFGTSQDSHLYKLIFDDQIYGAAIIEATYYFIFYQYYNYSGDFGGSMIVSLYNNIYKLIFIMEQDIEEYEQQLYALLYEENYELLQILNGISIPQFNIEYYFGGQYDEETETFYSPYCYQPFLGQYSYADNNGITHNITIEKMGPENACPEEFKLANDQNLTVLIFLNDLPDQFNIRFFWLDDSGREPIIIDKCKNYNKSYVKLYPNTYIETISANGTQYGHGSVMCQLYDANKNLISTFTNGMAAIIDDLTINPTYNILYVKYTGSSGGN